MSGVWDRQKCDRISKIPTPGVGESIAGVDVGEGGLMPETIASEEQAGVGVPQLSGRKRKRQTHPACRKSDGLL